MHWHAFGIRGGLGRINKMCYSSGVYRNTSLATLKDRLLNWQEEATTTGIVIQIPSLHYQFNGEFRRQRGLRFNNSENDSFFKGRLGIVWIQWFIQQKQTACSSFRQYLTEKEMLMSWFSFFYVSMVDWMMFVTWFFSDIRSCSLNNSWLFPANLHHLWVLLSWFLRFRCRTELSFLFDGILL